MNLVMRGIDISHWQGKVDFNKVKNSGVQFVIIKAGGSDKGFYTDSCFETNYVGAISAGLHVGAYYIVGKDCISAANGQADAKRFAGIIKGKKFDMPVYIDLEIPIPANRHGATDATIAFCRYTESLNYYTGIYSSDISGFIDRLELDRLTPFDKWVARYGKVPQNVKQFGLWQYSDDGNVSGINADVDLDYCYQNYPQIIKTHHFNGY
jgi:GH25 family lysozyme M1 (1,4-beta-N-acetylmuramidase)